MRTIRNQKRIAFIKIGDGSTTEELQAVIDPSQVKGIGTGTAISLAGSLQPCPPGLQQSHELIADAVEIVGATIPETYPIQKKYHTPEFLRTLPHLRLRMPFHGLLARLRSDTEHYSSEFFRQRNCIRAHPPLVTSSDCEGAGEVFVVAPRDALPTELFFRTQKYLSVSAQLHLEAYIHAHQAVWTLSPTFRAERSDTPRHLSEFYMLEAELQTQNLDVVMDVVENLVRHLVMNIEKSHVGHELLNSPGYDAEPLENGSLHGKRADEASQTRAALLRARWKGLKGHYYPRVTYTQVISLLRAAAESGEASFAYAPSWDSGLHLEHERYIASTVGHGSPVFVTHYPKSLKPFYMLPSSATSPQSASPDEAAEASETVANFDLLLPNLAEVAGGSLREHRVEPLVKSMRTHGLLPQGAGASDSPLDWYLDLRRYGSVPHGGFGLGFDRLLCYIAGVENVRDMVPWPRHQGRCDG